MWVALFTAHFALGAYCNLDCSESLLGNSECNQECMTSSCLFDNGECASNCQSKNCLKTQADNICDQECNIKECGYDWGDCSVCGYGCTYELFTDFKYDEECDYDNCQSERNITKYCLDFNIAYDITLFLDVDSTNIFPFLIDEACIVSKRILLIGHEVFSLTTNNEINVACVFNTDIYISPLYCHEKEVLGCYNEGEKAIIMVSKAVSIEINKSIIIEGIIFSQNNLLDPYCNTCNYCRATVTNGDNIYDDQGNSLTSSDYLNMSVCKSFHDIPFIYVHKNSSLTLQNVIFENMRLGFRNLIKSISSNVTIQNSDFYNIYASQETIFIEGNGGYYFYYENGTVSLINNGYEPTGDYILSAFLYLNSLESVIISNVSFKNNLVNFNSLNFINIVSVCNIYLYSLEFKGNYVKKNLIDFTMCLSSSVELNLNIFNCVFENNYVNNIINGETPSFCHKIDIESNNFTDNIASLTIIKIINKQDISFTCKDYFEWHFNLKNINFTSNNAIANIIDLVAMKNISFTNNIFENNYEIRDTKNLNVLDFTQSGIIYMKKGLPQLGCNYCKHLINFESIDNPEISHSVFKYNKCPLINLAKASGFTTIDHVYFSHNSLINFDNSIVRFLELTLESANITNIDFINNTYADEFMGLMSVNGLSNHITLYLDSIYIKQSNISINIQSIENLYIMNLQVLESLPTDLGIIMTISSNSYFHLSNSKFESGKSNLFSFKSENNKNSLNLQIDSVTISQYEADNFISIDSFINLFGDINEISNVNVNDSKIKFLTLSSSQNKLNINGCNFNNINIENENFIEVIGSGNVTIKNCLFKSIIANSIVYAYSSNNSTLVDIQKSNFIQNNASTIKISFSTVNIKNCFFYDSIAEYGSVAYLTEMSKICFENCLIKNNTALMNGVIFLTAFSILETLDTNFTENIANLKGGAIFLDQNSKIDIKSSRFYKNKAFRGSCIYAQHSQDDSIISDSDFFDNLAESAGCLSLLESNLIIANSNFHDNKANYYPALEIFYFSNATIISCVFSNHKGVGAHIGVEEESFVSIKDTQFLSSSSEFCCSVFKVMNSIFLCDNCKIKDSISYSYGALYFEKSNLTFSNSYIENVISKYLGSVIRAENFSYLTFISSTITNYTGSAIDLSQSTSALISKSYFKCKDYLDGFGMQGTGIQCSRCAEVIIEDSKFNSLSSSSNGGCLYMDLYDSTEIVIIKDSTFSYCTAELGGGIYAIDTNINIISCVFNENKAEKIDAELEGQGGALYFDYSNKEYHAYVNYSSFNSNFAVRSGGAIQWYDYKPIVENCTFNNNSAFYGPDKASFACKLQVLESIDLIETEFPPGQPISSPILIEIQDHYNQIVITDNSTLGELAVITNSTKYEVSGITKIIALSGVLNFSEIIVLGLPNTSVTLNASSVLKDLNYENVETSIDIKLRSCIIGEYLQNDNSCIRCIKGTYNLKAGEVCKKCPSEGVCYGGANLVASSGYWRYSKSTDVFFECLYSDACLEELFNSSTTNCLEGYKSNLCQSCDKGYSRSGDNMCNKCLDYNKSIPILIAWLIFNIVIIVGVTATSINDAFKNESVVSIYFKIFMNYLQLVTLTITVDLNWPSLVQWMFYYQSKVSGSLDQITSIDCFLPKNTQSYYVKLMFLNLSPIICVLFTFIFWLIWKKVRNSQNLKEKIFGSLVVQLFIFHPNLLKYNFSIFNCLELSPGQYYLLSDLSIKCWESNHLSYAMGVAIPSIIILCISLPSFLLIMMFKRKDHLECATEKIKYGFLYKGFKTDRYYWEFFIMLRKIIIICTSVFLRNTSTGVQALIIFLVILLAYIFQRRLEPYNVYQLNEMELKSILVSAVTIYAGLFFLTDYIDSAGKIILFCLMIITNFVFLIYWIYFTFGYYIGKIYLRFSFCRRCFRGKISKWVTKVVPETEFEDVTGINANEVKDSDIPAGCNSLESSHVEKKKAQSSFYPKNVYDHEY
ncbi:hypothetical protein SteCoe_8700 [Stentor coeruleus]|uniref:LNR domain-containing protein n=1 Tax=Stentor coeruleus TaxID=5963 RepID=A0A1R2CJQ4_9CILI|nr:hypothetical protein SteCoe_8700 [Stentor coeruleus]